MTDAVLHGCASRANADHRNVARLPGLFAGLPAAELDRRNGRYALCTMCVGAGHGIAIGIERM